MNNYIISDIDEFTDHARVIVYTNFGAEYSKDGTIIESISPVEQSELDSVLTHQECKIIVQSMAKKQRHKKTHRERFIINEKIFTEIIESINSRLVSNILAGLIKKGLVDSTYDPELNDFVFWVKNDENSQDNQKPKTSSD
jgi:hypothetical protein